MMGDLVSFYVSENICTHLPLERSPRANSVLLSQFSRTYNYALLKGRRVVATTRCRRPHAGSSLVALTWNGQLFAGEVEMIFHHLQPTIPFTGLLAKINWMVHAVSPLERNLWRDLYVSSRSVLSSSSRPVQI